MRLRNYTFLLLVSIAILGNQTTAEAMPKEFIDLNKIYLDQVIKLKNVRNDDLKNLAPDYLNNLKNLEKHYQASGELSPLLIVRKEYTRFKENPNISDIVVAYSPTGLTKLQNDILKSRKNIKIKCAENIIDLSKHYKKRLTILQKTLTKNGKIDYALKIMTEIGNIDSYPEIIAANAQLNAGGTLEVEENNIKSTFSKRSYNTTKPTPTPISKKRKLDKQSLTKYFHTRITRWNSITHEVTCKYNFATETQIKAWDNASFDKLRNRLLCDNTVSWFKPLFSSIKKIECDTYFFEGNGPIRIMLGKSLYADLLPTADGKAILHQGNASYPIQKSYGGAEPYKCYHNEINIEGWNVQWTVGQRILPETKLLQPIRAPIRIGLGVKNAKVMFSNITITGILSPTTIKAIEEGR